ncbi:hypothetical protein BX616_005360, partial [Lobosporangium transversale]
MPKDECTSPTTFSRSSSFESTHAPTLPPIPAPSSFSQSLDNRPGVMIIGAGLGGLLLGALLERIGIRYHIFERASKLRPLGATMTLSSPILPVFEQLGLLDEIIKFSYPCPQIDIYDADLSSLGSYKFHAMERLTGYPIRLFARPRLHELLLRQIPPHKISLGKKVLKIDYAAMEKDKDSSAIIHCSDNTSYQWDMVVGADGAYSGVRQSMYRHMNGQEKLPKQDQKSLLAGHITILGVTRPMDPEKYTQLKNTTSATVSQTVYPDRTGCHVASLPGNQISWAICVQLTPQEAKDQQFRNSEWVSD